MQKQNIGIAGIADVILLIAAFIFCAGCSNNPVSSVAPTANKIGHDEATLQYLNQKMEVEEINIVVDIYGDKNLVVDMGANYVPPFNEGHLVALNTYGQIYFSFGLENKGSSSIQITGATINDRDFGYADESVHPKGPKTISPGKIRTVSWLWPEKPTNNMRFTIEVKSSGGES